MPEPRPVFIALEGLRGCGKSTIAPLLADKLGAQHVPTIPAEYSQARTFLDHHSRNVDARAHLFASALLITAERVRALLEADTSVVIDSYVQRTIATHRAYGTVIDLTPSAALPCAITFRLECSAAVQATRLRQRQKAGTWWDELADQLATRIEDEYSKFPSYRINTTDQQPHETIASILATLDQRRRGSDLNSGS